MNIDSMEESAMRYWPWGIIGGDGISPWRWDCSFPYGSLDEAKEIIEKARKAFTMMIGVIDEDDGKNHKPVWVECYVDFTGHVHKPDSAKDENAETAKPTVRLMKTQTLTGDELIAAAEFISDYRANFDGDDPPIEFGAPDCRCETVGSLTTVDQRRVCGKIKGLYETELYAELNSPPISEDRIGDATVKFAMLKYPYGRARVVKAYVSYG